MWFIMTHFLVDNKEKSLKELYEEYLMVCITNCIEAVGFEDFKNR